MHSPVSIESITGFVEYVEEHYPDDYTLFRGQPKAKQLLPPIGRDSFVPRKNLTESERQMLDEFRAISLPFLSFEPQSELEWLAVAQHHGMSTRLLDWTTNPLAALWFAIRSAGKDDNAVDVWCLDANELGVVPNNVRNKPLSATRCHVYRPPHVSARIVRQSGWFTLHPIDSDGAFRALEADKKYATALTLLRIPRRAFADIRFSLDRYGAHEASFMPDLAGAATYIDWCHRLLDDEAPRQARNRSRIRRAATATRQSRRRTR